MVFFYGGTAPLSGVGSWCPLGVRSCVPGAGFCGTGGPGVGRCPLCLGALTGVGGGCWIDDCCLTRYKSLIAESYYSKEKNV